MKKFKDWCNDNSGVIWFVIACILLAKFLVNLIKIL
jgi:hypothetical protein